MWCEGPAQGIFSQRVCLCGRRKQEHPVCNELGQAYLGEGDGCKRVGVGLFGRGTGAAANDERLGLFEPGLPHGVHRGWVPLDPPEADSPGNLVLILEHLHGAPVASHPGYLQQHAWPARRHATQKHAGRHHAAATPQLLSHSLPQANQ